MQMVLSALHGSEPGAVQQGPPAAPQPAQPVSHIMAFEHMHITHFVQTVSCMFQNQAQMSAPMHVAPSQMVLDALQSSWSGAVQHGCVAPPHAAGRTLVTVISTMEEQGCNHQPK